MGIATAEQSGLNSSREVFRPSEDWEDFERHRLPTQPKENIEVEDPFCDPAVGVETSAVTPLTTTDQACQSMGFQKVSRRIYILGGGNFGKFVAHSLASIGDRPPITLLLHAQRSIRQWWDEGQKIEIIKDGQSYVKEDFDIEFTGVTQETLRPNQIHDDDGLEAEVNAGTWIIDKLVMTTKPCRTVPALLSIKHRLGPSSTICFMQNAMGVIDEVNEKVFPDPATRPAYIVGVASHSIGSSSRTFTAVQKKPGELYLSLVPQNAMDGTFEGSKVKTLVQRMSYGWTTSSRSLIRTLVRSPLLVATGLQYKDCFQLQLERLAVDAIISPLSVVFDCSNGKLLNNFAVTRLMRVLIAEISQVACNLPELKGSDTLETHFSPRRLEYLVVKVLSKTNDSLSDMLKDVRQGRKTDVDFINGYFTKRAEQLSIQCPVNMAMTQMVKAKQAMTSKEGQGFIPFDKKDE